MDELLINSTYNEEYYSRYGYQRGEKKSYAENDVQLYILKYIAKLLSKHLTFTTHLDVGCALGVLVAEMRKLGKESYGVDASEYAIKNAVVESRPFVKQKQLIELYNYGRYDLVTCIEVVEHLPPEEEEEALDILCSLSDTVFFTSANDPNDTTHLNVHSLSYWESQFYRRGYYPALPIATPAITWSRTYKKAASYKDMRDLLERSTRDIVMVRDGLKCAICDQTGVHIHEIVPRSSFGKKTMYLCYQERNRVCLCPVCHEKAHTKAMRKTLLTKLGEMYDYEYDEIVFRRYLEE